MGELSVADIESDIELQFEELPCMHSDQLICIQIKINARIRKSLKVAISSSNVKVPALTMKLIDLSYAMIIIVLLIVGKKH